MPQSDAAANNAFAALTSGVDFDVDIADLSGAPYQLPAGTGAIFNEVTRLTNEDLTSGTVGGDGTFDALMTGLKAHLDGEFKNSRISGAEYTKAFIALTEGAMGNAVQYLLGRDTSYWQSIGAQLQAQTAQVALVSARVQLETAKAQLVQVQLEAQNAKAVYALTKMKLASESVAYDTAAYNLANILPQQLLGLQAEANLSAAKLASEVVAKDTALYTLSSLLPQQLLMVKEQTEAQRAQTLDTRTDGATVVGAIGKQKALYDQQITSYQRDAEVKAAKIFTDAWITQKSMDEGVLPPTGFTNVSIQTVLDALKLNNNLN